MERATSDRAPEDIRARGAAPVGLTLREPSLREFCLRAAAVATAPGAACFLGPWCAWPEVRRRWRAGRRRAAAEFALAASAAPLFVAAVALQVPALGPYLLASTAFHLWRALRPGNHGAGVPPPWPLGEPAPWPTPSAGGTGPADASRPVPSAGIAAAGVLRAPE